MADGVQIRIDDKAAREQLSAVLRVAQHPAGIMAAVADELLFISQRHIQREQGPGGAWPRLSPRTANGRIGRRRRGTENMLRVSGRLYASLTQASGADYALVGSNLRYAAIHQTGGTIDMPERSQTIYQAYDKRRDHFDATFRAKGKSTFARDVKVGAHRVTIPARPYLYVDADDAAAIEAAAADALRQEAGLS